MIRLHKLPINNEGAVDGRTLQNAVTEDKRKGLIPFFVSHDSCRAKVFFDYIICSQMCATLGTTSCCTFDNLEEIGQVCKYL